MLVLLAIVMQISPDQTDAGALLQMLITAIHSKNWAVVVSLVVMALTMILNRIVLPRMSIDKKWTPLISAIMGTVISGGSALLGVVVGMPIQDILSLLLSGLLTGASATGLYELIGKYVMPKPPDVPTPPTDPKV